MQRAKNDQIHQLVTALGIDEEMLRAIMSLKVTEATINEYGRLDDLKATIDKAKARAYFEAAEGVRLPLPKVNIKADKLLREFILGGGFDIQEKSPTQIGTVYGDFQTIGSLKAADSVIAYRPDEKPD